MRTLLTGFLLAAASLGTANAQSCPSVEPRSGYPLSVATIDSTTVDVAWLRALAQALAYRWEVPSGRRDRYTEWDGVRRRLLPPEPRWADDWQPSERHRARLLVTFFPYRSPRQAPPQPASGDRAFDRSLTTLIDPLASPPLPSWPAGLQAESLMIAVNLGFVDSAALRQAVIRFAAQQRPARLIGVLLPGAPPLVVQRPDDSTRYSIRNNVPWSWRTVKFDVREDSTVNPESVEILRAASPQDAQSIRDALGRARFEPAESNCRLVAMSVLLEGLNVR